MTKAIESVLGFICDFIEFVQTERRVILNTLLAVIVVSLIAGVIVYTGQDKVSTEEPIIDEQIGVPINETPIIDEQSNETQSIDEVNPEEPITEEQFRHDISWDTQILKYRETWEGETLKWFIDEGYNEKWDDATFLKWMKGVSDDVLMGTDNDGLVM